MSTAPGAPDEGLLRKIELKADLKPEDVEDQDVQTARQEVLGLAADPAVEERLSKLRTSVQEYRTAKESELATPEAARAKVAIEDISRAIDEVQAQPRVEIEEPVAVGKWKEFGLRMQTSFEQFSKGEWGKASETLGKAFIKTIPLFALRLLRNIPLIGETLKPYIAQAEGIDAASKALSPSKLLTTDRDDDLLKQLQGQYDAKPEEFKKSMSFEKFLEARARSTKRVSSDRGYTLLSLVNAKLDSEIADESAARTKKTEEVGKTSTEAKKETEQKVLKKNSERLDEPRFRDALYTYVLARALRDRFVDLPGVQINADDEKVKEDLAMDSTSTNYKSVAAAIKTAFGGATEKTLGVVIDDGDLEESNGTNWFYDLDIITYFDPEANPADSVKKILGLGFGKGNEMDNGWDLNERARKELPELQNAIRKHEALLLGDFSPLAKKEETPAPAPAPADVAAAPAPAPTPAAGAAPTEAPATQTA